MFSSRMKGKSVWGENRVVTDPDFLSVAEGARRRLVVACIACRRAARPAGWFCEHAFASAVVVALWSYEAFDASLFALSFSVLHHFSRTTGTDLGKALVRERLGTAI